MQKEERIKIGVPGVDELIAGGLKPASLTLVTGTTGTGKCVHAKTSIFVDGKLLSAEQVYDIAKSSGTTVYENDEEHLIALNNLTVPSLNKSTLKVEKSGVSYVYRQKYAGTMINIRTRSGREITVTPEHPFIVINQGVAKVKAQNIKVNDFIAVPRTLPEFDATINIDNSSLESKFVNVGSGHYKLKGTSYSFKPIKIITPDFVEWLGMLQAEGYIRNEKLSFTSSDRKKMKRFKELTTNLFEVKQFKNYESITTVIHNKSLIQYLKMAIGFQVGRNKIKTIPNFIMQLPKKLKAVYLKNYFGFDGSFDSYYIELTNANKETINRVAYLLLEFGIVARLSIKEVKDVEYAMLTISGAEFLKIFQKNIGFCLEGKNEELENYLKTVVGNTNIDIIPNVEQPLMACYRTIGSPSRAIRHDVNDMWSYTHTRSPSRLMLNSFVNFFGKSGQSFEIEFSNPLEDLKKLANSDVFWDEVVNIESFENDQKYVYDLTVPGNHTFVAGFGGIITHNTIFCSQFLYEGAKTFNEPGVYVTFEEPPENIKKDCLDFGWNFEELEKQKKILFVRYDPFHVEDILDLIESNIKKINAKRVVIDSVSALGLYLRNDSEVRRNILNMSLLLRKLKVTCLLTSEILPQQKALSRFGVEEFVADGVIVLYYLKTDSQYSRSLTVWKMRGTDHSLKLHPYQITKKGIIVYPKEEAFVKM